MMQRPAALSPSSLVWKVAESAMQHSPRRPSIRYSTWPPIHFPSSDCVAPKLAAKNRSAYIVVALLLPDLRERAAEGRLRNDGEGGRVRGDIRQIEKRRQVVLRAPESSQGSRCARAADQMREGDRGGVGAGIGYRWPVGLAREAVLIVRVGMVSHTLQHIAVVSDVDTRARAGQRCRQVSGSPGAHV